MGLSCRLYLGTRTPRALGVGVDLALISLHVRLVTVGHWINGNIIVLNALMLGAVNHAGDPIETACNPPLSPASTRSVSPASPSLPLPPPSEGLGEGREAPSVVDIKEPRVSSPPSVPTQEQGERGRATSQVRGGEGDASATSLASAWEGGGSLPSPSWTP